MGGIGVGKTTLVQEAERAGCVAYAEYVNGAVLKDYNEETARPNPFAFDLQLSMMHGSITRTLDAVRQARRADCDALLVERPAVENVIFAQVLLRPPGGIAHRR